MIRDETNRVEHQTCLLRRIGLLAIVKPPLDGISCGRVVTLFWLPSDMHEALADRLVLNIVREKLARFLCHAEEGVLIFFDLGFEVRQARLIVREDPGEVRLLSRNLPFLLLNHDRVSVICGGFAIYGDVGHIQMSRLGFLVHLRPLGLVPSWPRIQPRVVCHLVPFQNRRGELVRQFHPDIL